MNENQPKKRPLRRLFRKLLRIGSYFVVALFAFLIGVGVGISDTPTDAQESPVKPVATVAYAAPSATGEERAAEQENEVPAFRPEPDKAAGPPESDGEGVSLQPATQPDPPDPPAATEPETEPKSRNYRRDMDAMGHLAGQITREREAIERFRPVGVWSVRQTEAKNAPRMGYIRVFEDGTATMVNPNCGLIGHGRWQYEPRYMQFTMIEPDGTQVTSAVLGVPWASLVDADGRENYTSGYVWLDSGRTWMFLSSDPAMEC